MSSLNTVFQKISSEEVIQRHLHTPPTKCRYQKHVHKYIIQGTRRGVYKYQWVPYQSPVKLKPQKTWLGEHIWDPILCRDYSSDFEEGCKYPHYFDATRNILEGLEHEINNGNDHGYTAINDDLFLPTGYYADSQQMDIVFDSGCTTSVTPNKSDFIGEITTVNKIMQGLSSTTKITGEGVIK